MPAYNSYYEIDEHDIDSGFVNENDIHDVHQVYQQPLFYAPRMSKEKWVSLSRQEQQAWDTISNKSKSIILGILSPQPPKRNLQGQQQ